MWVPIWLMALKAMAGGEKGKLNFLWLMTISSPPFAAQERKIISAAVMTLTQKLKRMALRELTIRRFVRLTPACLKLFAGTDLIKGWNDLVYTVGTSPTPFGLKKIYG